MSSDRANPPYVTSGDESSCGVKEAHYSSQVVHAITRLEEGAMPKKSLDPESLAVETFPTTSATIAVEADEVAASRTSCPGPPYCTC